MPRSSAFRARHEEASGDLEEKFLAGDNGSDDDDSEGSDDGWMAKFGEWHDFLAKPCPLKAFADSKT